MSLMLPPTSCRSSDGAAATLIDSTYELTAALDWHSYAQLRRHYSPSASGA